MGLGNLHFVSREWRFGWPWMDLWPHKEEGVPTYLGTVQLNLNNHDITQLNLGLSAGDRGNFPPYLSVRMIHFIHHVEIDIVVLRKCTFSTRKILLTAVRSGQT